MDAHAKNLNSLETARDVAFCYSQMSLFYAKNGQADKAKFYADKVLAINREKKQNFSFQNLELALFKIDSLSGKYLSSIGHYQEYNRINDSLFNISKNKQIEELKIQYETLKKEQNIKTLKVQTKLQQSKLDKSSLLINLSIWSIILLLIIISLLYNRYQLKQRNNLKLEIKEKEIDQKNSNLQHLLDEKEWLVKEIHHRVKNNLQTVISLLNTQSAYLDDETALSTLKSSQHRIHAMSLIHQKLYMSENVSTINMPIYIKELVGYLKDSYNLRQHIRFEIKIEQLELDVAQAVPLGLIINEAVVNSIKYAFPNNRDGIIAVTLAATSVNRYLLTVQDNGVGIPIPFNQKKISTFGMSLIKGLSDDLDGTFSIGNNNGTLLKLSFEKDSLCKKNS
jgi:two-component sensor histidine kinase